MNSVIKSSFLKIISVINKICEEDSANKQTCAKQEMIMWRQTARIIITVYDQAWKL